MRPTTRTASMMVAGKIAFYSHEIIEAKDVISRRIKFDWLLFVYRCDQGGDCECICNVLADFASECSTFIGELFNWRAAANCRKYFF